MNVKRTVGLLLSNIVLYMTIAAAPVNSLEIVIIPIAYYEKQGSDFVQRQYSRDIAADIMEQINMYYDVRINRMPLRNPSAGVQIIDVHNAADYYRVDEILYGSMKNDGNSFTVELNIYNNRRRDYGKLFASDAVDKYDRLINTISGQILDWYNTDRDKVDALRNEVRNLRSEVTEIKERTRRRAPRREMAGENEAQEEVEKEFKLRVPVSLGYWSYTNKDWVEMVQGTVEVVVGIDMYPELQFPDIFGMKNEVSLGIRTGYRNGVTRNRDRVVMNGIVINPAVKYHLNFYTQNWVSIGTGIFYELGIWDVGYPDFNGKQRYTQSLTGYSILVDYSYRLNNRFTINFGTDLYGYFAQGSSPLIKAYFGTVISVLGGDNAK
jgi:hypothetical protein